VLQLFDYPVAVCITFPFRHSEKYVLGHIIHPEGGHCISVETASMYGMAEAKSQNYICLYSGYPFHIIIDL
jgi:hypothetical protein